MADKNDEKLQKLKEMHGMGKSKKFVPPPLPEIQTPEEFFVDFFTPYVESKIVSEKFVDFYAYRISRKKELPTPQALAADLAELQSGVKNPRQIQFIVEDYAEALNEYLKKTGANVSMPTLSQFGISVQQQWPQRLGIESIQIPQPQQSFVPTPFTLRDNNMQMQQNGVLTIKDLQIWQLQQEIQQLKKEKEKEKEDETVKMLMKRIDKLEEEKRELERQRLQNLEEKLERMESEGKLTKEDVENIIKNVLKVKEEKITKGDIEAIIRKYLREHRPSSLTPEELERIKIEKEHELKKMELEEKKATRESIGKSIKEGFTLLGQAIARTIIETGSGQTYQAEGVRTSSGLIQIKCPNCGRTFMVSERADRITCPYCGKSYVFERPTEQQIEQSPPYLPKQFSPTPKPEPEIEVEEMEQPEENNKEDEIKKRIENVLKKKGQPSVIQDRDGMWVCPICNKKFRTKNGALGHIRFTHLRGKNE